MPAKPRPTRADAPIPAKAVTAYQTLDRISHTAVADTEITFVLTSGGHNAGIVSEPGHNVALISQFDTLIDAAQRRAPEQSLGTIADVGAGTLMLAGDGASLTTGETIHIDGGLHVRT